MRNDDPESMSRPEIAEIVRSGQLTQNELRKYVTTYQEKLCTAVCVLRLYFDFDSLCTAADSVERKYAV